MVQDRVRCFFFFILPYGLTCWRLKARHGIVVDAPLFHYRGVFKRLKRIVKFALPYFAVYGVKCVVERAFALLPARCRAKPRTSVCFPEGAQAQDRDFGGCRSSCRTAVMAVFFADGRIPETTLHYLRGLKEVVGNVVLVGDCPLLPGEVEKLRGLVNHCRFARHEAYDFGSYRRGLEFVLAHPVLATSTELVFCNDSCFGPVVPFAKLFADMCDRPCDFWGLCEYYRYGRHIQSYFLVFKRPVWTSAAFSGFMRGVVPQSAAEEVIVRYEVGLSRCLFAHGFSGTARYGVVESPPWLRPFLRHVSVNPTLHPVELMKRGCPLIKVKAVCEEAFNLDGLEATRQCLLAANPELHAKVYLS